MVFSTNVFIFFFLPVTVFIYRFLNVKLKTVFLLLASMVFYCWSGIANIKFILILIIMNYIAMLLIKKYPSSILLGITIMGNILLLVVYKYMDYLIGYIYQFFKMEISFFDLTIPLGISFIVFHAISLQVDMYRQKDLYQSNPIEFATYLLFFPKLLQGPIVLYKDYREQKKHLDYSFDYFISGVERFIVGLAKKVIIADVLMEVVIKGMNLEIEYGIDQPTYWLITVCYVIVMYFDFSGYSDMAIGISRMFGFRFKENFNFPYIANSITDFWRRWHISLGTFFKEYVYIPLGGNRRGNVYFHLGVVFVLTGIWHGAGFVYLLWGCLHGSVRLIEKYLEKKQILQKIPYVVGWLYTTIIVSFGWLMFLLGGVTSLFSFVKGLFGFASSGYIPFTYEYLLNNRTIFTIIVAIIGTYVLAHPFIREKFKLVNANSKAFNIVKYIVLSGLFIYSLISIISGTYSPFIYFQY